jgi:hypothetical protein
MARSLKVGVEFTADAKSAEAGAKRTQDAIKKTADVAKQAGSSADDMAKKLSGRVNERFGQVGLTMGAIGIGIASVREGMASLEKQIADAAPEITGLTNSVTGFGAAAREMAELSKDPAVQGFVGSMVKWTMVAIEGITKSRAEAEINFQRQKGADENRARNESAYLAMLDEESNKKKTSLDVSLKNIEMLAKMNARQREANTARAAGPGGSKQDIAGLGEQPMSAAMELATREYQAEQDVQLQRERAATAWHDRKIDEINRRYSFEADLIAQQTAALEEQADQKQAWGEQEMQSAVSLTEQFGTMAGQHAGMMIATGKTDKYMREMTKSAAKLAMQMAVGAISAAIMNDAIKTGGFGAMASAIATVGALSFAVGAASELMARGGGKMEQGGLVARGGVQNRDTVPMMLMPGERVLSKEQSRQYEMGQGSGAVVVNMSPVWQTVAPPSEAEVKRFVMRNLRNALEELAADGLINMGARA